MATRIRSNITEDESRELMQLNNGTEVELTVEQSSRRTYLILVRLNARRATAQRYSDIKTKILQGEKISEKDQAWFARTGHRLRKKYVESEREIILETRKLAKRYDRTSK